MQKSNMLQSSLLSILPILSLSLIGISATQVPLQQHSSTPLSNDFDNLVLNTLNHLHVPGLSIAIIDGNQTFAKVINQSPRTSRTYHSNSQLPGLRHRYLSIHTSHTRDIILHRLHHQIFHWRRSLPPDRLQRQHLHAPNMDDPHLIPNPLRLCPPRRICHNAPYPRRRPFPSYRTTAPRLQLRLYEHECSRCGSESAASALDS